jgi:hypothetical protein
VRKRATELVAGGANSVSDPALLVALLLTAAEFLVMDYDARQRVVLYQAEATLALAARG